MFVTEIIIIKTFWWEKGWSEKTTRSLSCWVLTKWMYKLIFCHLRNKIWACWKNSSSRNNIKSWSHWERWINTQSSRNLGNTSIRFSTITIKNPTRTNRNPWNYFIIKCVWKCCCLSLRGWKKWTKHYPWTWTWGEKFVDHSCLNQPHRTNHLLPNFWAIPINPNIKTFDNSPRNNRNNRNNWNNWNNNINKNNRIIKYSKYCCQFSWTKN